MKIKELLLLIRTKEGRKLSINQLSDITGVDKNILKSCEKEDKDIEADILDHILRAFHIFVPPKIDPTLVRNIHVEVSNINTFEIAGEVDDEMYKSFSKFMRGLPNAIKNVTLLINSGGGEVHNGLAIADMIMCSDRKFTAVGVGAVCSIATSIACACDQFFITKHSRSLIHDPALYSNYGGKTTKYDAEVIIDRLVSMRDSIWDVLGRRLSREFLESIAGKEYYIYPDEALKLGYIDGICTKISHVHYTVEDNK